MVSVGIGHRVGFLFNVGGRSLSLLWVGVSVLFGPDSAELSPSEGAEGLLDLLLYLVLFVAVLAGKSLVVCQHLPELGLLLVCLLLILLLFQCALSILLLVQILCICYIFILL